MELNVMSTVTPEKGIISVFERKEVKYLLTLAQRDAMLREMEGYMMPDQYGLTTICNVYFDTPNSRLVRESIEKPVYKEKLRMRTYGVPKPDSNAFIELKKKFEGIVYKRRETLPYHEAWDFLVNRIHPSKDSQIMKEIEYALDFYEGIAPAMALFYDRQAYFGCEDAELRMTIDTNLRSRTHDIDLLNGSDGEPFSDPDICIMEIKILDAMPLWMADILDRNKIYPCSFSKYGTAYTKNLIDGGN